MIRDWRLVGMVNRKAKWMSSDFMAASGAYLLWNVHPRWAAWTAIACMGTVAAWLRRRPERPPDEDSSSG
ncbi:MAG TPA: hypothetical protein DDX06_11410 [Curvibacter sp.]|nr:hypothetical protein [Curvibacter sp.]